MSLFNFLSRNRPRIPAPYQWDDTPDVLGKIEGARVWRIGEHGLVSVVRGVLWKPGETLEARCLWIGPGPAPRPPRLLVEGYRPCAQVPQPDCSCGIWGAYDYRKVQVAVHWRPGKVMPIGEPPPRLIGGAIAAHGRVVEGKIGFRAQYANVTMLSYEGFSKDERSIVDELAEKYAVPVVSHMPKFKKPE